MDKGIKPGIRHTFRQKISKSLTVPKLLPNSLEFQIMPNVLATGYMVGLIEWACIQTINPFIDWPNKQTVGIHINVSHLAATPPGLEIEVTTELVTVEGRKLVFEIEAIDNFDLIGKGTHERFIIHSAKFNKKTEQKAKQLNLM
jgi:fluoroacetyl-CoA thioesterase